MRRIQRLTRGGTTALTMLNGETTTMDTAARAARLPMLPNVLTGRRGGDQATLRMYGPHYPRCQYTYRLCGFQSSIDNTKATQRANVAPAL
jgi:hypothetical protein